MSSLYIHIPFCHSKCAYCDFYSTPQLRDVDTLVDCLIAEYGLRKSELKDDIETIYIGGGTPSILPITTLRRLVESLPTHGLKEFTIEVNPEDVTAEAVSAWRSMGIDRVSMGVQSLSDDELALIGRRHTAAEAVNAASIIRDGGIENISLDLIYALPGQTMQSWLASLRGVLDLNPQHLSAYMLSYEPHTRLTAMLNAGKIEAVDEELSVQMYQSLIEETRRYGYEHYEISNFAKPGFRAKHNSGYWDGTPYLGLGPSAHSYDGKLRRINPLSIKGYCEKILAGTAAFEVDEETRVQRFNDMVITRLRTAEGLDFAKVPLGRRRQLLVDAYPFLLQGTLTLDDNRLRIPEQSWLISDSILRDLIQ